MMRRILAAPLAGLLLLHAWGGCAAGRSELLAAYDPLPYKDTFLYAAQSTDVIRSISDAVISRGGTVTLIDHRTGRMTAEIETGDILPEEAHAQADDQDESLVTAIFAGILAVFVFIILFGWLGDGCGNNGKDDEDDARRDRGKEGRRNPERLPDHEWEPDIDVHIGGPGPEPVRGYRYVLSFAVIPDRTGSTKVRIRTLRMESENGTVVRTTQLQNKYLLYGLDESVRAGLVRR